MPQTKPTAEYLIQMFCTQKREGWGATSAQRLHGTPCAAGETLKVVRQVLKHYPIHTFKLNHILNFSDLYTDAFIND